MGENEGTRDGELGGRDYFHGRLDIRKNKQSRDVTLIYRLVYEY